MSDLLGDTEETPVKNKIQKPWTKSLTQGAFLTDPYPFYEEMQADYPALWYEPTQLWYVSRYQDVERLFLHKAVSSDRVSIIHRKLVNEQKELFAPLLSSLSRWVVFRDPPLHTQIRKVVNQAFSAQVINGMQDKITQITQTLVKDSVSSEGWDIVSGLAYPLPVILIAEMLGVPAEDRDLLKQWSDDIANFFGRLSTDPTLIHNANKSIAEANDYLGEVIKRQQKAPKDNVIQVLIDLTKKYPDFTHDDLIANCMAILFAGHETTTNLISTGFLTLLNNPDQLALLRDNRNLMTNCVEECLRYEPSVQRIGRTLLNDIEVAGTVIPKGAGVLLLLGACGRDPRVYKNPNQFDIQREHVRHLSFGWGIHNCSGSHLARMEAATAFNTVLDVCPNLRLINDEPQWHENVSLRGLKHLLVS